MLRTIAYTALCSAALIGSSAYAADNAAAAPNPPTQTQAPLGVNFVTSQDMSQWRAPKLIGVGVYGPDDKQMGKIDDLLVRQEWVDSNSRDRCWRIFGVRQERRRRAVLRHAVAHGS